MGFWTKKFNNTWFGKVVDWISDKDQDIQSGVRNFLDYGSTTGENALGSKATNILNNLTGETAQQNFLTELEREDTRYQRLMADLSAAGINPSTVLGSGGVSAPSGVAGSVSSNIGALGQILSSVADSGLKYAQSKKTEAETEGQETENALKQVDLAVANQTALEKALLDIEKTTSDINVLNTSIDYYIAQTKKLNAEIPKVEYEAEYARLMKLFEEKKYDEALEAGSTSANVIVKLTSQEANTIAFNLVKAFGFKLSHEDLVGIEVPYLTLVKAAKGDKDALRIINFRVGGNSYKPPVERAPQPKGVENKFKHK